MAVRPMSALDVAFLSMETPTSPIHTASVLILKKPPNYKGYFARDLYEKLRDSGQPQGLFHCRPMYVMEAKGKPCWVEAKDFDMDAHLHLSALAAPGGREDLFKLVSRLHQRPLDQTRPLWECYVIDGVGDGQVALYCKTHHALLDGVGGMEFLNYLWSEDPDEPFKQAPWAVLPVARVSKKKPGTLVALSRMLSNTTSTTTKTIPQLMGLAIKQGMQVAGLRKGKSKVAFQAPKCVLNQQIGAARTFGAADLLVSEVKAVSKALSVTVNDVILAVCAGSLREYLLSRDLLPSKPLITTIPVSVRSRAGVGEAKAGNQISYVLADLATDVPDLTKRINRIAQSTSDAKDEISALSPDAAKAFGVVANSLTILLRNMRLTNLAPPPSNVTISNVPGVLTPRYVMGAHVEAMYPVSVLVDGQGLNITILTQEKHMHLGIIGCRRAVSDPQRMADAMVAAFEELKTLAGLGTEAVVVEAEASAAPAQLPAPAKAKKAGSRKAAVKVVEEVAAPIAEPEAKPVKPKRAAKAKAEATPEVVAVAEVAAEPPPETPVVEAEPQAATEMVAEPLVEAKPAAKAKTKTAVKDKPAAAPKAKVAKVKAAKTAVLAEEKPEATAS